MCENNLPKVALCIAAAWIRTSNLVMARVQLPNYLATKPRVATITSALLTAPIHGGIVRLSWPRQLVT